LGAPMSVSAVQIAALANTPEGSVQLEYAMSDSPAGPFDTWVTDPTTLGAHRYLRWQATIDRYFLQSGGLDRLEIDLR